MPLWHTIPGETPIEDISGLIIKGISRREELNLHEAKNILKAAEKYLLTKPTVKAAPFDFAWALRLHRDMFGEVWTWAGQVRREPTNIGVDARQLMDQIVAAIPEVVA